MKLKTRKIIIALLITLVAGVPISGSTVFFDV